MLTQSDGREFLGERQTNTADAPVRSRAVVEMEQVVRGDLSQDPTSRVNRQRPLAGGRVNTRDARAALTPGPISSINLQLSDGSRLFAVSWVCRPTHLFLRLHRLLDVTLDDLIHGTSLSPLVRTFLGAAVRARMNFLISGGMGDGKTTLLRALASDIPPRNVSSPSNPTTTLRSTASATAIMRSSPSKPERPTWKTSVASAAPSWSARRCG